MPRTMKEENKIEIAAMKKLSQDAKEYAELWQLKPYQFNALEAFVHRVYIQGKLAGLVRGVSLI